MTRWMQITGEEVQRN